MGRTKYRKNVRKALLELSNSDAACDAAALKASYNRGGQWRYELDYRTSHMVERHYGSERDGSLGRLVSL